MAFARGALAAEVDMDPLAALLQSVRLAAGIVAYYRLRLGDSVDVDPAMAREYSAAVERLNRCARSALDAGVSERMVQVAERTGDWIVQAAESAMLAANFTGEQRVAFARDFAAALARREESGELGLPELTEG